ncbi:collagen-like triple helix repeat-containing protein [Borrelia hermsii]|nr:collagen-like protein [Borrelia hermsii]
MVMCISSFLGFLNCTGPAGARGPAGPSGASGPPGSRGPRGERGLCGGQLSDKQFYKIELLLNGSHFNLISAYWANKREFELQEAKFNKDIPFEYNEKFKKEFEGDLKKTDIYASLDHNEMYVMKLKYIIDTLLEVGGDDNIESAFNLLKVLKLSGGLVRSVIIAVDNNACGLLLLTEGDVNKLSLLISNMLFVRGDLIGHIQAVLDEAAGFDKKDIVKIKGKLKLITAKGGRIHNKIAKKSGNKSLQSLCDSINRIIEKTLIWSRFL